MQDALFLSPLPDRGLLQLEGPEALSFLQGLVSNDVTKLDTGAVYAALLTAQGKFLHDFFMFKREGAIYLDCEGPRRADLLRRLTLYRLRAKVALSDVSDGWRAYALVGGAPPAQGNGWAFADPRHPAMGWRLWMREQAPAFAPLEDFARYDLHRLALGLPDGSRDMPVDKALLMESNFEALQGVDFQKGCYIGQEITARMKYRALVKKLLLPVLIEGGSLTSGAIIHTPDGREAGEMRSSRDERGLALLRLDALDGPLVCEGARLVSQWPAWLPRPEAKP